MRMNTGSPQTIPSDLGLQQQATGGIEIVSVNVGRPTVLVRWPTRDVPT